MQRDMNSMTTMKLQQEIKALIKTWTWTAFSVPSSLVNNVQRKHYVKMKKNLSTSSVSFRDLILHTQGLTRMVYKLHTHTANCQAHQLKLWRTLSSTKWNKLHKIGLHNLQRLQNLSFSDKMPSTETKTISRDHQPNMNNKRSKREVGKKRSYH